MQLASALVHEHECAGLVGCTGRRSNKVIVSRRQTCLKRLTSGFVNGQTISLPPGIPARISLEDGDGTTLSHECVCETQAAEPSADDDDMWPWHERHLAVTGCVGAIHWRASRMATTAAASARAAGAQNTSSSTTRVGGSPRRLNGPRNSKNTYDRIHVTSARRQAREAMVRGHAVATERKRKAWPTQNRAYPSNMSCGLVSNSGSGSIRVHTAMNLALCLDGLNSGLLC